MPVYAMTNPKTEPATVIVDAKSEVAARLHLTRDTSAKVIGAKEIADLVLLGVKVERAANGADEAEQAALRG